MDQVEGNNSRGKRRIGRIDAKPGSHYDNYEVYLGKFNHPFLAVVNQSDPEWKILINDPNTINGEVVFDDNIDNGYREDEDQKGDFKFGSFDFNPADPKAHPDVYGCWGLGTFVAKWVDDGNGYSSDRKYEQMFTTLAATVNDNGFQQKFYESRGHLDEVFFDGSNVVFHPENSDIIMIGAPDNGVLRSIDGGQTWSSRKPRGQTAWENDYGTEVQKVYHIAFHSIKNNGEYKCVFASAGVLNNKRNNAGQGGELLINDDAGAGGSDRWSTMAGGPGEKNDLPNGEIHSFVFDPKPGWKKGSMSRCVARGYTMAG